MTRILTVTVVGTPAPQGSKDVFTNARTGRHQVVESSAGVKPWRQRVQYAARAAVAAERHGLIAAARRARRPLYLGPVRVSIVFRLARPAGHYGTGRNAAALRPTAPATPAVKPDLDKLIRSTFDALTDAGVWEDDARVVAFTTSKVYATGPAAPGATIWVEAVA